MEYDFQMHKLGEIKDTKKLKTNVAFMSKEQVEKEQAELI